MKNMVTSGISTLSRALRNTPLGRSEWLGDIHANITLWFHRSNVAQVGEFKVTFDPRDRYIAKKLVLYGAYEKHEISLLTSLVAEGDYVLDVGANIGLYTLHLSRAVGPHGRVFAVEPDPDNLVILKKNLADNDCNNVTIIPHALGNKHETLKLYQVEKNRGNLSFADLGKTGTSIEVDVKPGKDVFEPLVRKPRVMKIDVEGAEPLVLEGIDFEPEFILFEYVPSQLEALGQDPLKFLRTLQAKGYALHMIGDEQFVEGEEHSPSRLYEYSKSSGQDQNILAILTTDKDGF